MFVEQGYHSNWLLNNFRFFLILWGESELFSDIIGKSNMDECHNVINFEQFDAINVDDATERKMVNNNNFLIDSFDIVIECQGFGLSLVRGEGPIYLNHRILFNVFFLT